MESSSSSFYFYFFYVHLRDQTQGLVLANGFITRGLSSAFTNVLLKYPDL